MDMFIQFSLIIFIVLAVCSVMRILRQPLIIGYIISGIILGPLFLNLMSELDSFHLFSQIGIALLLFIVGLHLSPRVIKEVGKASLVTGAGQIVFTSLIGFLIATTFGFGWLPSLYIAVAMTFSSTIIIMKLLSDKEALEKLYGKISIGFLLFQDLVAILILMGISSFSAAGGLESLMMVLARGALLVAALALLSHYLLPRLNNFFARSQEFLFVFSVAWGLGLASLFFYIGFSIEIGALLAGVILSVSSYSYEISGRLKPLRDFFIIFFFLILGSQMIFSDISGLVLPAILFSLFILIGNPLIVMALMGRMRYNRKTGFMAGLTVAQISEFSLVLVALGVKVGHLSPSVLSFVTLIGMITIAGSTYMIIYSDGLYSRLSKFLMVFERKRLRKSASKGKPYKYILMGYNRIGYSILNALSNMGKEHLVIDFDPEIIRELKEEGVPCVYGDVEDVEFLDEIGLRNSKLIVSTIPEMDTNLFLLRKFRKKGGPAIVLTARHISDALELYRTGADYVILPHFLGGEYASHLITRAGSDKSAYWTERKKEISALKERLRKGHAHPEVKKNKRF